MLKDHKALELDKILLQLANETTCPDAAELAQKIEPDTDIRHVGRHFAGNGRRVCFNGKVRRTVVLRHDECHECVASRRSGRRAESGGIIVCCRDIACYPQCFGLA